MNIYDFDKTIYKYDSSVRFYIFCLRKNVKLIVMLPLQFIYLLFYLLNIYDTKDYKEHYFSFLKYVKNVDHELDLFWENEKLEQWYIDKMKGDDIIISASPEFLLLPICKKIKTNNLIGTHMDKYTGIIRGKNCKGEEKVVRLKRQFGHVNIHEFYSDSLSDTPLANMAEKKMIVKNGFFLKWSDYAIKDRNKKNIFFTKQFLQFLIIGCINAFNGIWIALFLSLYMDVNRSFVIAYLISLTIAYVLNCKIIFVRELGFKGYSRFCLSYIPNFFIQNIVLLIVYNYLEFPKIVALILAVAIGLPVTFILVKFYGMKLN